MKRAQKRKKPSQVQKEGRAAYRGILLGALAAVIGLVLVQVLGLTVAPIPPAGSCVIERYTVGMMGSLELPRFVFDETDDSVITVAYYPEKCTINSGRSRVTSKSDARRRMRIIPCCAEKMYEKDTN